MSSSRQPTPPRRQYPEAYERALPIVLGLLVIAIVVLLVFALIVLLRSGAAGG